MVTQLLWEVLMSLQLQKERSETHPVVSRGAIPLLRNGDRLQSEEFLRRYEAMPGVKAELIDGRVYLDSSPVSNADGSLSIMASPVRIEEHADPHAELISWLGHYRAFTFGVRVSDNGTLLLDLKNNPQPDVHLRVLPECGGQSSVGNDRYLHGGPELVAEISASSVSYDLHEKLEAYLRHGVKEYLVWRVEDHAIDWFVLREGEYKPLAASEDGVTRSEVFPGLWLDRAALLRGELNVVLDVLRRGLESAEHAEFVVRLRNTSSAPRE
jgi:Uma2 family endonuclease